MFCYAYLAEGLDFTLRAGQAPRLLSDDNDLLELLLEIQLPVCIQEVARLKHEQVCGVCRIVQGEMLGSPSEHVAELHRQVFERVGVLHSED